MRKKNEENLEESEELYRNILESMSDGILVLNKDFRYTHWNKSMEKISKTPREEVVGNKSIAWEIFPHLVEFGVDKLMKKAMNGEIVHRENIPFYLRNGTTGFTSELFLPLKNKNNEITGVVGVIRDITQQKKNEEELRRLRNLLSNIINSMPSVLVAVNTEENIILWNNEAEKVTGIKFDEAEGCHISDKIPHFCNIMDLLRKAIDTNQIQTAPRLSRQVEEIVQFWDITIYPLFEHNIDGAVIRMDNVTERVRMEEMMIQSEKMISIGGMAAGIAHEINNPLGAIVQNIQNISRRLSPDLQKNTQVADECGINLHNLQLYLKKRNISQFIESSSESGKRMGNIIKNMLQFSRRSKSKRAPTDLLKLIDTTIDFTNKDFNLKKDYDFRSITIIKDFGRDLPLVPCTATEIEQVILNLLQNAAYAMAEDSSNKSPRIILRAMLKNDMAQIEVEDNGPGMDKSMKKSIFEPFYTTKPVGEGTGIGLSIAYMIITNHKGTLEVESQVQKGSKFVIRLPLKTN